MADDRQNGGSQPSASGDKERLFGSSGSILDALYMEGVENANIVLERPLQPPPPGALRLIGFSILRCRTTLVTVHVADGILGRSVQPGMRCFGILDSWSGLINGPAMNDPRIPPYGGFQHR